MNRPNLFDYATHELSQDAVLIWLLRYADSQFAEDLELHNVAQSFVRLFLGDYTSPVKKVEVWKQWANIDITVKVNDEVGIVIEDKAGAHLHGDQLRRYKESANQWGEKEKLRMGFYYLNTENPNPTDCMNVINGGYTIIKRRDILSVLNGYKGDNVILHDFRDRLMQFESETESYKALPFSKWTNRAWQGFYDWIHEIREESTWDWLNPPSGSFLGMWWNNFKGEVNNEFSLYPQIDQGRLTFKMYCETDKNREWGYKLRDKLESIAQQAGVKEIHRPARMSFRGCATALLVVDPEAYLGKGVINLDEVKRKFEVYERIIELCRNAFLK